MDELLSKLKMNGMGGARVFSAKDLEGMSSEELAAKFSSKGTGNKAKKSKEEKSTQGGSKKKDSLNSAKQQEGIVDDIEL